MSSYDVGDHLVDHPPLFACRKHKAFLKLNRNFVEELVAWAPDIAPANLTELAAASLGGDDEAFRLSDYLIPPKVTLFNPRKIQGHGALPYVIVFVDKRFFGIPSSYLRRRIFDGCEQCVAENDPASDASMPDYRPRAAAPRPAAAPAPAGAPGTRPMTKSVPRPPGAGAPGGPVPATGATGPKTASIAKPGAAPRPAGGSGTMPAPQPAPQQGTAPNIPASKPTKSVPKMPGAPSYKGTAPDGHVPPPPS